MDHSKKNPLSSSPAAMSKNFSSDRKRGNSDHWEMIVQETNENDQPFLDGFNAKPNRPKSEPDFSGSHFDKTPETKSQDWVLRRNEDHSEANPLSGEWNGSGSSSHYKPYDPLTNYLSPRPEFLRYNPNRSREIYLRRVKEFRGMDEWIGIGSSHSSGSSTSPSPNQEDGSFFCVDKLHKKFVQDRNTQNIEEEEEEEEVFEEEERVSYTNLIWQSLLLLVVLFFSVYYMSNMNSCSVPSLQDFSSPKDPSLKIQDRIPEITESLDMIPEARLGVIMGLHGTPVHVHSQEMTTADEHIYRAMVFSDDYSVRVKSEVREQKEDKSAMAADYVISFDSGNEEANQFTLEGDNKHPIVYVKHKNSERNTQNEFVSEYSSDHQEMEPDKLCNSEEEKYPGVEKLGNELVNQFQTDSVTVVNEKQGEEEILRDKTEELWNIADQMDESENIPQRHFFPGHYSNYQGIQFDNCGDPEEEEVSGNEKLRNGTVNLSHFISDSTSLQLHHTAEASYIKSSNTAASSVEVEHSRFLIKVAIGVLTMLALLGSWVKGFLHCKKRKNYVNISSPMPLESSEALVMVSDSSALSMSEKIEGESVDDHVIQPHLVLSRDNHDSVFSRTHPPTVELLGEFSLAEASESPMVISGVKLQSTGSEKAQSQRYKRKRLTKKALSSSGTKVYPSPLVFSSPEPTSNGSFKAQQELLKKDDGGDRQMKLVTTPVRRSNRLRDRVT